MKKVALIVFNPFINDSRVLKEAQSLTGAGYDVEVIAHGYKDLPQMEKIGRIKIVRFRELDRSIMKQKKDKLKIYLFWLMDVIKYTKKFDVLHCNDLITLPIGVFVKKFFNKKIKVVYDAHEYETEIEGLNGITKKIAKMVEKLFIVYADKVITVSQSIANEYKRLYPFIDEPVVVLNTPNYKKIEKKDLFRTKLGIGREKTIFLYQGGLSMGRGIEIILETFKSMKEVDTSAVIVFMGYGPLEDLIKTASKEFNNIFFYPAVSPQELLDYTSSADFGILFYENSCLNHYYCSPNKMFEYIMAEIPVIVSNLYEMKRLVEKYNVGLVAQENTVKGLKEVIRRARNIEKETLKINIKKIKQLYNWESQEKNLINAYKDLT